MKQLKEKIFEKLKLNKDLKIAKNKNFNEFIENIDTKEFQWSSAYALDDYQNKCKTEVQKFVHEIYPDSKYAIEQLFKDTYKQYLESTTSWSESKINSQYDSMVKTLDKIGWGQFSYSCLEQGWIVFMYWLMKKYKK